MEGALKWSAEYLVEIGTMDEQHEELISIANELCGKVDSQLGMDNLRDSFNYLLAYANYHLGMEEKVMQSAGYPGIQAHVDAHEHFRDRIKKLKETFDAGDASAAGKGALFLIRWLTEHIKVVDRQFADYLREQLGEEEASAQLEKAYFELSSSFI